MSGTRAAPALFALLVLGASARAQSFDDTVQAFYGWVLANPSRGLPSARGRVDLANLLSLELITLLRTAAETQARCVEAAPQGDKPLIVEGDLFVGNHEGATEIVAGKPRRDGDRVIVESDLFYVDDRFPKAHNIARSRGEIGSRCAWSANAGSSRMSNSKATARW